MFNSTASFPRQEKIKERRTFGIWFYGIVFLISGVTVSVIFVSLVRNIMLIGKVMGVDCIPSWKIIFTAIFGTLTFVLCLSGILVLSRKKRGLILAICTLLTLWGILGKVCCTYFIRLNHVIAGPDSVPELVLLASAVLYFSSSKIKDQFR